MLLKGFAVKETALLFKGRTDLAGQIVAKLRIGDVLALIDKIFLFNSSKHQEIYQVFSAVCYP